MTITFEQIHALNAEHYRPLREAIDAVEADQTTEAVPLDYVPLAVALTARGDAHVAVYRLKRQLRALDDTDLADLLESVRTMVDELEPVVSIA